MVPILLMCASPALSHEPPSGDGQTDPCRSYEQDLGEDLRLLAIGSSTAAVTAATTAAVVPKFARGQAVTLTLAPQSAVRFLQAPERPMIDDGSYGGFAAVDLASPGRYRISVSAHAWVDLLDEAGGAVTSAVFAGRTECQSLKKLVEFVVDRPGTYTVQLSGSTAPAVQVLVRVVTAADK
jgi:hypothetical protein